MPLDLSLVAERRAAEAPGGGISAPERSAAPDARPERTIGRAQATTRRPPKGPVLTTREERVRRLLVRELDGLNRKLQVPAKSWAEKKEREGLAVLDVSYIDREIAKMQKQLSQQWPYAVFLGIPLVLLGLIFGLSAGDPGNVPWLNALTFVCTMGTSGWGFVRQRDALRRKLYIYEALRALSDADELDVVLSRAAEQADALIARIVDAELAAADRRPAVALPFSDSPDDRPARSRARVR